MNFNKVIKILFLIIIVLFLFQCCAKPVVTKNMVDDDSALRIAKMVKNNSDKLPHKSVAVIEFTDINGRPVEAGKLLSERIISCLVQYKELKVIERSKVNKVLEELKLSSSGLTDAATAKKIGRILNVDALVTGTLAPVKDYVEINARMIDTENAQVLSAIIIKDRDLDMGMVRNEQPKTIINAAVREEEKKVNVPRVDVVEYKIEKIAEGLGENYATIKISGTAVYVPANNNKTFKDLTGIPVFNLLDSRGKKVSEFKGGFKCGDYGSEDNIEANEPFPFTAEDGLVKKELWDNITSCQFIKWGFVK